MKKFLKDLETELRKNNLKEEEIEEILADHQEMIESAINEGLTDEELSEKFGDPVDVAKELSQFTDKEEARKERRKIKEVEFDDVKENYDLDITLVNEDVEFELNDDKKIIVVYRGKRDFEDYTVQFEKNKLEIKAPRKQMRFFSFFDRNEDSSTFLISLPKGMPLNSFRLKEVNGDIEVSGLNVNDFVIETTNGDVELKNMELGSFKTGTVNGDIELENITCKEYTSSMISGDINIDGLKCEKDIYLHTVSGDIKINNSSCDDAILKTVSGDLEGKEFYPKSLSLKSVSGDITIDNSDKSKEIEIKQKRTLSGDISINRK